MTISENQFLFTGFNKHMFATLPAHGFAHFDTDF